MHIFHVFNFDLKKHPRYLTSGKKEKKRKVKEKKR